MDLQLSSIIAHRISNLARRTGFSPLVLIHRAIEEFLDRHEKSDLLLAGAGHLGDYEPQ